MMLSETIIEGPLNRLKKCRHGYMLFNGFDEPIGRSLSLYGEWAQMEMAVLGAFLKPGIVVVDVGSNIGTHSVFLAKTVGKQGLVIAIEPQRIVYQNLCANVAINGHLNVQTIHAAAGSREQCAKLPRLSYDHRGNYGGVALGDHEDGEDVVVLTIDSLDLPGCELLKIDVEGMELLVLEGADSTIEKYSPVIYLENNSTDKSAALIAKLTQELDYDLYWHFSPFYNPHNYYSNDENVFGHLVDANMLCIPSRMNLSLKMLRVLPDDTAETALSREVS